MPIETERKFLTLNDSWKADAVRSHRIVQGYLSRGGGCTVRVRIRDTQGFLTIKGPSADGISRYEWEKEIPLAEAEELLALCRSGKIDKVRYLVPAGEGRWFEVDEFHGDNEGLVVAEIELDSADEAFSRPAWLGEEVTGNRRYYNAYLSEHPWNEPRRTCPAMGLKGKS